MSQVVLSIAVSDHTRSLEEFDRLRMDLSDHVGPTDYERRVTGDGAKGLGLAVGSLAVTLLNAPTISNLVNVIQSYLTRDRILELEFTGPGGSGKLRAPVDRKLTLNEITDLLDRVTRVEGGHATSSSPGM